MVKYDKKAAQDIEVSYQTPEVINQRMQTLQAMSLRAGERVLDAGCGTGLLIQGMVSAVGENGQIVGIDFSDDMLDVARERFARTDSVNLQQASVTDLPLDSGSFDAASCTQTLLYVDDVEKAISELYRVLKPGGRIAVLETDWRGLVLNSEDDSISNRVIDAWDKGVANPNLPVKLNALLQKQGFTAIGTKAIPLVNTSYSRSSFSAMMLQFFAEMAVKQGVFDKEASVAWLNQFPGLDAQQAYFFCINRFLFTAVK